MSAWRLINQGGRSFLFSGALPMLEYATNAQELIENEQVIWWRTQVQPVFLLFTLQPQHIIWGNIWFNDHHGLFKITVNESLHQVFAKLIKGEPASDLSIATMQLIYENSGPLRGCEFEVYHQSITLSWSKHVPALFDKELDWRWDIGPPR
jgi:hypothetical protein